MATDVDVQYFSHLNGLTLGNNWGDLIRLLDKALVTGIDFTQITTASIDEQGDVHITLYAAHNAMLFQVVELSGFTPSSLNQRYRIKGVPNTTQLILKPALDINERSITVIGTGKLASLGYDIIFRDTNDVKRVYRSKNPTAQHPFIRVDETISDGVNSYNSAYAKSAMVGLIENMTHIDDYENPDVLQLPFDPSDPAKNWKITGTGASVVRGWSKWYWASDRVFDTRETDSPPGGSRLFTLTGDADAFYLINLNRNDSNYKVVRGCGLFNSSLDNSNWFLCTLLNNNIASSSVNYYNTTGGTPLVYNATSAKFFATPYSYFVGNHVEAIPIVPNYDTGRSNLFSTTDVPALEIPFYTSDGALRGSLKHIYFAGKNLTSHTQTTVISSGGSMCVLDSLGLGGSGNMAGVYFYLGELE